MAAARILIVDDEPDIVVFLSSFLEDEGYDVASAEDSVSAMAWLEREIPDLILVDVRMPGRSGLDLIVNLRRDGRLSDIPLLLITGDDRVLEDGCRTYLYAHRVSRGPDAVLGKPIVPAELLAVVKRLTG